MSKHEVGCMRRRMRGLLPIAAFFALGGCVTATPIITPGGQQGFSLDCSAFNDIGQCYRKAGEICGGNGYEIYDQNNKPEGFFSPSNQTMVMRCKQPGENATLPRAKPPES